MSGQLQSSNFHKSLCAVMLVILALKCGWAHVHHLLVASPFPVYLPCDPTTGFIIFCCIHSLQGVFPADQASDPSPYY